MAARVTADSSRGEALSERGNRWRFPPLPLNGFYREIRGLLVRVNLIPLVGRLADLSIMTRDSPGRLPSHFFPTAGFDSSSWVLGQDPLGLQQRA